MHTIVVHVAKLINTWLPMMYYPPKPVASATALGFANFGSAHQCPKSRLTFHKNVLGISRSFCSLTSKDPHTWEQTELN